MITISNGWLNNTISYSRINKIADAARAKAWLKPNSDPIQADHSRDMELGEMIYDYFFCAGVKKEFMNNLYAMAFSRESLLFGEAQFDAKNVPGSTQRIEHAKLALTDLSVVSSEIDPEQYCSELGRYWYKSILEKAELPLTHVMSGNSLQYGHDPYDHSAGDQNFLIFRDRHRRIAAGIPTTLPKPAGQIAPADDSTTAVDTYDGLNELQVECLGRIRQQKKLTVAGHTFDVRFTNDTEPVVLVPDDTVLVHSLQTRLSNLWVIETVHRLLDELRGRCFQSTQDDFYRFGVISDDMRRIYDATMDGLAEKVNQGCAELGRLLHDLESETNTNKAAIQDFRHLKEKIILLDRSQRWVKTRVDHVKAQIETLYDRLVDRSDPAHLLKLFDLATGFILSNAGI